MSGGFWRGRRVFLTGHTGFKGGWLSLWLQQLGADVTGYALAPPEPETLFDVARVAEGMDSQIGDVRDLPALSHALDAAAPEIVFHLAAQPLVRRGYQDPVETYGTNVMGTVHLLEAVRRARSVRAVVVVTSDKCYENREWVWGYRETDALGGRDPYSSSKACTELVCAAYRASFFTADGDGPATAALATVRAGNVIGGGDRAADRLVPDTLAAFAASRAVRIRHPHAVRPWQHVLDPLAGYLRLARQLFEQGHPWAQAWNFGPDTHNVRTVKHIVERLAELWGPGSRWEADIAAHPQEATQLTLDSSRSRVDLGWQPRIDLEAALRMTVEWERARLAGSDMRLMTLKQITDRPWHTDP